MPSLQKVGGKLVEASSLDSSMRVVVEDIDDREAWLLPTSALYTALSAAEYDALAPRNSGRIYLVRNGGAFLGDTFIVGAPGPSLHDLVMGAGGFVTEVQATGRTIVARTDTAGVFKWAEATASWSQLLTGASLPESASLSVEAVAVAPSNPQVLFVACGQTTASNGKLFKSVDGGASWTKLGLTTIAMGGNEDFRWCGPRLAVDPADANHVLFGTRKAGLYRSTDGGANWAQISTGSVPVGTAHAWLAASGVGFVAFDPTSALSSGRTSICYCGVSRAGIYRSTDGGATWSQVKALTTIPMQGRVDPAGTLFVTCFSPDGSGVGAVGKLVGTTWTDITPSAGDYSPLAVDGFTAGRLFCMQHAGGPTVYRSTDSGATWTTKTIEDQWSRPGFWPSWYLWSLTGNLLLDPDDRLWVTHGAGASRIDDSTASGNLIIAGQTTGMENVVTYDAVCPSGTVLTAIADWDGSYFSTLTGTWTVSRLADTFSLCTSIAYCAGTPTKMVRVSRNANDGTHHDGYSTDGGFTWSSFGSLSGSHPAGLDGGVIAISATNVNKIVWQPTNYVVPYYTTNGGTTWTATTFFNGSPYSGGAHTDLWNATKPLDSDKVAADTFYIYHHAPNVNGHLCKSTDGGANWTAVNTDTLPTGHYNDCTLRACPGKNGWLMIGFNNGLYRSTDAGSTWRKIQPCTACNTLGFGKARRSGGTAVYVQGTISGVEGIHLSEDFGNSWAKITDWVAAEDGEVRCIAGDLSRFGRIILGTGGAGFRWLQLRD